MNNKWKNFFQKLSKKKIDIEKINNNTNDLEEEYEDDDLYSDDDILTSKESLKLLVNEKQKMDFIKNKDVSITKLLDDLSLDERELLNRELEFKYDFTSYKIVKINREKNFINVNCVLTTDGGKLEEISIKICPKSSRIKADLF